MIIESEITVTVADGDEWIMPPDTTVLSIDGNTAALRISYEYAPFSEPDGPAHVFETDILKAADGALTVERGVLCINFPNTIDSRVTTRL